MVIDKRRDPSGGRLSDLFLICWAGSGSGPSDGDGNYVRVLNPDNEYAQVWAGKTAEQLREMVPRRCRDDSVSEDASNA